jgi:catechol 2,3-dioxygenase-like lactoylglutathione lyase family enzyme
MATIKPIALTTHDLEQVASFSKDVFGRAEVGRGGSTHISDGDLNLPIRACKKREDPDVGAHRADGSSMHHIGFLVDNVVACADRMKQAGATRLILLDTAGRRGPSGRGQPPSHAEVCRDHC